MSWAAWEPNNKPDMVLGAEERVVQREGTYCGRKIMENMRKGRRDS